MNNIKYNLSSLDWCMFLDSGSSEHIDSNWSIHTAEPIATLTENAGAPIFLDTNTNVSKRMYNDPLSAQQIIRNQFFYQEEINRYPFTGGVIAAYHYEMGELFETIHKSHHNQGLELGRYHCGFYDWAILFERKTEQYYLVQHRIKNNTTDLMTLWEQRYQWLNNISDKIQTKSVTKKDFMLSEDWQANYNQSEYHKAFEKIQDYILSGDCYQVNLAQRFKANYIGNEYQAYQALLTENKPPFAAFVKLPEQVIISMSPERFLLSTNRQVQTKPIKGTMPRDTNQQQDTLNKTALLQSEKDKSENLMIVDLLRNDIGRVCETGTVSVPKLFDIESFPAVHHLVSTVMGTLAKDITCEDLLRACFPGGSITGAPKIRSMEIITELEKYKREIYCGSIAYVNGNGNMDSSITIRTLVCKGGKIYCWAGGGIVADSIAESEYQECFDKVSKILPILQNLNK